MRSVILVALLLVGCDAIDPVLAPAPVDAGADVRPFDPVVFCETCKQQALLEQREKALSDERSQLEAQKTQLEIQITQLQRRVLSMRGLPPDLFLRPDGGM